MSDATKRLTAGERLMIDRRRRGETQAAAAKRHNVSRGHYASWELGRQDPPSVALRPALRLGEWCLVRRHRLGLTQAQLGERVGLCRLTIKRMERCEIDVADKLVRALG